QVQQLTPEIQNKGVHAFPVSAPPYSESWGRVYGTWNEPVSPKLTVPYFTKVAGPATIRIKTAKGQLLKEIKVESERGLNYVDYDLTLDVGMAGAYEQFLNEGRKSTDPLKVTPAPNQKLYL